MAATTPTVHTIGESVLFHGSLSISLYFVAGFVWVAFPTPLLVTQFPLSLSISIISLFLMLSSTRGKLRSRGKRAGGSAGKWARRQAANGVRRTVVASVPIICPNVKRYGACRRHEAHLEKIKQVLANDSVAVVVVNETADGPSPSDRGASSSSAATRESGSAVTARQLTPEQRDLLSWDDCPFLHPATNLRQRDAEGKLNPLAYMSSQKLQRVMMDKDFVETQLICYFSQPVHQLSVLEEVMSDDEEDEELRAADSDDDIEERTKGGDAPPPPEYRFVSREVKPRDESGGIIFASDMSNYFGAFLKQQCQLVACGGSPDAKGEILSAAASGTSSSAARSAPQTPPPPQQLLAEISMDSVHFCTKFVRSLLRFERQQLVASSLASEAAQHASRKKQKAAAAAKTASGKRVGSGTSAEPHSNSDDDVDAGDEDVDDLPAPVIHALHLDRNRISNPTALLNALAGLTLPLTKGQRARTAAGASPPPPLLKQLRTLNLSQNNIQQLTPLLFRLRADAPNIVALSLWGNPGSRKPDYREQVRTILPNVFILDGEYLRKPPLKMPFPTPSVTPTCMLVCDTSATDANKVTISGGEHAAAESTTAYDLVMTFVTCFFNAIEKGELFPVATNDLVSGGDDQGAAFAAAYLHPSATFSFTLTEGCESELLRVRTDALSGKKDNLNSLKGLSTVDINAHKQLAVQLAKASRNMTMGRAKLGKFVRGPLLVAEAYRDTVYPFGLHAEHHLGHTSVNVLPIYMDLRGATPPLPTDAVVTARKAVGRARGGAAHSPQRKGGADDERRKVAATMTTETLRKGKRTRPQEEASKGATSSHRSDPTVVRKRQPTTVAAKQTPPPSLFSIGSARPDVFLVTLHGILSWRASTVQGDDCVRLAYDRTMTIVTRPMNASDDGNGGKGGGHDTATWEACRQLDLKEMSDPAAAASSSHRNRLMDAAKRTLCVYNDQLTLRRPPLREQHVGWDRDFMAKAASVSSGLGSVSSLSRQPSLLAGEVERPSVTLASEAERRVVDTLRQSRELQSCMTRMLSNAGVTVQNTETKRNFEGAVVVAHGGRGEVPGVASSVHRLNGPPQGESARDASLHGGGGAMEWTTPLFRGRSVQSVLRAAYVHSLDVDVVRKTAESVASEHELHEACLKLVSQSDSGLPRNAEVAAV